MKTKLCKIQNIETEKKELLDVMQAWHGLSKYNSATAVSISFYAQSQKKISKSKKYYQDRNHKCIQVR